MSTDLFHSSPLYKYQSPQSGFEGSREISASCGAEYFAKHRLTRTQITRENLAKPQIEQ